MDSFMTMVLETSTDYHQVPKGVLPWEALRALRWSL
jgi:hypothetical protein